MVGTADSVGLQASMSLSLSSRACVPAYIVTSLSMHTGVGDHTECMRALYICMYKIVTNPHMLIAATPPHLGVGGEGTDNK